MEEPVDLMSPFEILCAKEENLDFRKAWNTEVADAALKMADFVYQFPHKWRTVRERLCDSRATQEELAARAGVSRRSVINHWADWRKFMGEDSAFVMMRGTNN